MGDPGVDRHHLIFISSCHTTKIHTRSFPKFGLTLSFRDFMNPPNCVDPHCQVVSYLLTFLPSLSENSSPSCIPFGCSKRCGRMLMVGSLPSSFVVSLQRPPSSASLRSLNGRLQVILQLCSTTICGQIDHMYIYRDT